MVEENSVATALYRLAILENQPIHTANELVDWFRLRKWVLSDERLLQQYREQRFFACADEVTKNEMAPKNNRSLVSRFLTFLGINK